MGIMLRTFLATLMFFGLFAHADFPVEGSIGPGAMVGTLGSISGKYFFSDVDAVDAGVEFLANPWTVFYIDYYRHFPKLFGTGSRFGRETSLYAEVGTGGGFWDRTDNCGRWNCTWNKNTTGTGNGFFARILIGLEWYPRKTHYSIFTELGPSYLWYPTNGSTFDAALGGRYYF